jgi:hypothetical protein
VGQIPRTAPRLARIIRPAQPPPAGTRLLPGVLVQPDIEFRRA